MINVLSIIITLTGGEGAFTQCLTRTWHSVESLYLGNDCILHCSYPLCHIPDLIQTLTHLLDTKEHC